jgi:hypothetical protein
MLSYWFTGVAPWVPLMLAIVFAVLAVIAVVATLARRQEEQDANLIATLYGVGLGIAAVSELMMYLDVAFGWSLAVAWSMAAGLVAFFAIMAVIIAVVAIIAAVAMQYREENAYNSTHGLAH